MTPSRELVVRAAALYTPIAILAFVWWWRAPGGLSSLNKDQIAERGARIARREAREYREYLSAEQRREPGCPAREVVLDQQGQATGRESIVGRLARAS